MHSTSLPLAKKYDAAAIGWRQRIAAIGYPAAYRDLIRKTLQKPAVAGFHVLDAGAGCGDFSVALADGLVPPRAIDLLDISQAMLDQATHRLEGAVETLRPYCCALEAIPHQGLYDLVLCANVIEHCPDPVAALTTLRHALKPGGQLLLVASKPHWCTAIVQLIWRNTSFRPSVVSGLLQKAGFTDIALQPFADGPPSRVSFGYHAYR